MSKLMKAVDPPQARFQTTRWGVVALAVDSNAPEFGRALETLCSTYWYPLYAYIRRSGYDRDDAKDLTQGFFEFLLEKRIYKWAEREKGRFRTFLLASLKNFLADRYRQSTCQKRGGTAAHVPLDFTEAESRYEKELTISYEPEKLYDREWATAMLRRVFDRLKEEYEAAGCRRRFELLSATLLDPDEASSYAEIRHELGMSESGVKSASLRLRRRFRELYRAEIGALVESPLEVESEIQHLMASLS